MNYKQKIRLMRYLNLTGEIGRFLCGDLFVEFAKLIPLEKCFNKSNIASVIRKVNKDELIGIVGDFLNENKKYSDVVNGYFKDYSTADLYEHLLTGYVFYLSLSNEEYSKIDIFKDSLSALCTDGVI